MILLPLPPAIPDHHAICNYDCINMIWSGEALLNSCAEALKQDLKFNIQPNKCCSPKALVTLLTKLYHPSQSKIESLKDRLKSLLTIKSVLVKMSPPLCKMRPNAFEKFV